MTGYRLLDGATADLEEGVAYYLAESDDIEVALRFDAAVWQAMDDICAGPRRWPREPDGEVRRYHLARPFDDWSIVYRVSRPLLIVAIAHGRRRPGFWRTR